jgi:hypothetical protein
MNNFTSTVFKPPFDLPPVRHSLFLAGSIEMGKAEDWQTRVENELKIFPVDIFNPRRDDWDSSWVQSIKEANFKEQVMWELQALERAEYILMYFDPTTMSPISLLELGLHARTGKLIVVCPDGFWRKGNVDVVCRYYDIRQYNTLDEAIAFFRFNFTI